MKEYKNFDLSFKTFKNKIILYGIGVKTQEILQNSSLDIVGLMDRDSQNIGKYFYGVKVLSEKEAIKISDTIIIASSHIYFDIIFQRIKHLKNHGIKIYFCNGEEAKDDLEEINIKVNPNITKESLRQKIDKYSSVSFDIFDTLVARKTLEPTDIFYILQNLYDKNSNFALKRISTELSLGENATFEKIYNILGLEYLKDKEQELEKEFLYPKDDMVELYHYALSKGKKLYLVSDTCHGKKFIEEILGFFGIFGYEDIFISSELKKRKSNKTLWSYVASNLKENLHIGDNPLSDIEYPKEFKIDTFYAINSYDMLQSSALKSILPKVCTLHESLIMGALISKIFPSSFSVQTDGKICIKTYEEIGYIFFAPILFTYILWIVKKVKQDKIDTLLFIARDGYFLEKLYHFLVQKLQVKNLPKSHYLLISRTLATILNIQNEADIDRVSKIKFVGYVKEFFWYRFGLKVEENGYINTKTDKIKLDKLIQVYKVDILKNAKIQQKQYKKYINNFISQDDEIALVEPSFNGTILHCLSSFLDKDMVGFYCNANLSDENSYFKNNMFALFQQQNDKQAFHSNIRKNTLFFEEGILVAPTGSPIKINEDLSFIYTKKGITQNDFNQKEKIFDGVKSFFEDMLKAYKSIDDIEISPHFVDALVGVIFQTIHIPKNLKDTFYCDSIFEQVYERRVFE